MGIQSGKRARIQPNSPDMVEEDEDTIWEREIEEALAGIDDIVDLNEERNMEDVPIHEEIPLGTPSRVNVDDDVSSRFARLHTRFEKLGGLNNRMSRLARIERNQERLI